MPSYRSFLPLVELCDNFNIPAKHPDLVSFCITSDTKSVVGLLQPSVVERLLDDNEKAARAGQQPSWGVIHYEQTEASLPQVIRAMHFSEHLSSRELRSAAINKLCWKWHEEGLFLDVIGGRLWRFELYPVYASPFGTYERDNMAFEIERAAATLFGVVTYTIQMTLYMPPPPGSNEETKIWVSTRAKTKQE